MRSFVVMPLFMLFTGDGMTTNDRNRLLFLYINVGIFSGAGAPHDTPQPLLRDPHTSRSFTNQPCDTSSASNSARSSTSYKHSLVKARAARTPPRARRRCLDSLSRAHCPTPGPDPHLHERGAAATRPLVQLGASLPQPLLDLCHMVAATASYLPLWPSSCQPPPPSTATCAVWLLYCCSC